MGELRTGLNSVCIRKAAGAGRVAAALGALLLGHAAPAAAQVFTCNASPFTAKAQLASNWCWAASAEMTATRFSTTPLTQCAQADQLRARLGLPAINCCGAPAPVDCNLLLPSGIRLLPGSFTWKELPPEGSTTALTAGQTIPFEPSLVTSPPPGFSLKEQVCQKARPVVFTWKECGGGYHMMVVKGVDRDSHGGQFVRYVNPSPVTTGGSTYKVTYSKFAWGNTCIQSGVVKYMGQGKVLYEINKP